MFGWLLQAAGPAGTAGAHATTRAIAKDATEQGARIFQGFKAASLQWVSAKAQPRSVSRSAVSVHWMAPTRHPPLLSAALSSAPRALRSSASAPAMFGWL
jgi:hypothetical protein